MLVRDGSRQKKKSFIHEIEQGMVSFLDKVFAIIEWFVERRGRDPARVTVTPIGTVQYCIPRSPSSEISFDTRVHKEKKDEGMEKKDEGMEKKDEGRINQERDQLEPPSASMEFETPGQQCHPTWETGRTTADGCLLVGVGSKLGGNTLSSAERVGTRADSEITIAPTASNTVFLQPSRKPRDKKTSSE